MVAAYRAQLLVPPQSGALSPPFFTLSEQEGAWHLRPVQTPLRQLLAMAHVFPVPHPAQLPPQSMSVSSPFFTPSVQPAAWQM